MSTKTKAIIAVVIAALTALGYFFINTTAKIEATFAKVGAIAIAIIIIACAVGAIVLINKINKAKLEHDEKKAKRAAMKARKAEEFENPKPVEINAESTITKENLESNSEE